MCSLPSALRFHLPSARSPKVLSALGVVFDFPRMPNFDALMNYFSFISLDFMRLLPLGCVWEVNYHTTLVTQTLMPIFLCGCLTLFNIYNAKRLNRLRDEGGAAFEAAQADILSYCAQGAATVAFLILFLVYPSTSAIILRTFQCFELDDGTSWLRADFSIDCASSTHARTPTTWPSIRRD